MFLYYNKYKNTESRDIEWWASASLPAPQLWQCDDMSQFPWNMPSLCKPF